MSNFTDPSYLKNDQYRDASRLDARVLLHERFSTNPQGWYQWVFDSLAELPLNARVLELGCGPGYLWRDCRQRIPSGWSITLSDLTEGMRLAAWRNLVVTGRAFKYEQIDAQSIPYPDETFEIIIANHMLYHIPDRARCLQEIRRVLKPGGQLVASTVGQNHMLEMETWLKQVSLAQNDLAFRNTFTLENGQEQLAPFFKNIIMRRYPDSLSITEIEPLLAYIRSSISAAEISELELAKLRQTLEEVLATQHSLNIHKDSGLFLAIRLD